MVQFFSTFAFPPVPAERGRVASAASPAVSSFISTGPKDTKEPFPASRANANYGRSKETDRAAAQAVLQDMLQVWRQEPHLVIEVQEVPRKPDEAKEQDARCQEVT